jgi:pimeloyl-ACP methyl ester carboxylesterase
MSKGEARPFRPFRSDAARRRYLDHYETVEALWPLDSETRVIETEDGSTFIRISGPIDASPLVLLPGATVTSLTWRSMIGRLSERFRTYALDAIYDSGRSVPSRPTAEIADVTGWLDRVFDALGLTDGVNLMGLSYGAYATAQYGLHAPQRVRKAVWLSPAMTVAPISRGFLMHLLPSIVPARAPLASFTRWVMPDVATDAVAFNSLVDELYLSRRCYGVMSQPVADPVLSDDTLAGITVPVLYIVGAMDGVCDDPAATVARLNTVAPQIETVLVPGAAHDMVSSQADVVSAAVLRFLEA